MKKQIEYLETALRHKLAFSNRRVIELESKLVEASTTIETEKKLNKQLASKVEMQERVRKKTDAMLKVYTYSISVSIYLYLYNPYLLI